MKELTIRLYQIFQNGTRPYRAEIQELRDFRIEVSDEDQEGKAFHTADDEATALGKALLYLKRCGEYNEGAKLNIL